MEIFDMFLNIGFWAATVRMATPLIFGTLGELICERAGVLNLGIEGIMTTGAMVAWMWVYQGGDLWSAVFVAAFFGMMFGYLHSIFSVYCCPVSPHRQRLSPLKLTPYHFCQKFRCSVYPFLRNPRLPIWRL
jgi:hypothetical protein